MCGISKEMCSHPQVNKLFERARAQMSVLQKSNSLKKFFKSDQKMNFFSFKIFFLSQDKSQAMTSKVEEKIFRLNEEIFFEKQKIFQMSRFEKNEFLKKYPKPFQNKYNDQGERQKPGEKKT